MIKVTAACGRGCTASVAFLSTKRSSWKEIMGRGGGGVEQFNYSSN